MGNLEKLVVLTVFFLAGVVLAVSMNSGSPALAGDTPAADLGLRVDRSALASLERTVDSPPERGPGAGRERTLGPPAQGAAAEPAVAGAAADEPAAPSGAGPSGAGRSAPPLLSASAERAGPTPGLLRSEAEGIVPTLSEQYSSYTCRAGDTFAALAERFYGASEFADALRSANEGVALEPGTLLYVPRDARPTPLRATSVAPRPVRRTVPGAAGSATPAPAEDLDGTLGTEFREHTVRSGETLSHVAERYYGSKSLWRRVFDANRDLLRDPDQVREGMVLRIP